MPITLLTALIVLGAPQTNDAPAAAPAAFNDDAVGALTVSDENGDGAGEMDAADADDDGDEEEVEPFPWDTVSGVVMGMGGFLVGIGGTAAGAGALLLTAPGTLAAYNVAAFALLGAGAVVGLLGTGAAGGGGALYWFTLPDEEEDED